jgi:FkbM family methyltransferase
MTVSPDRTTQNQPSQTKKRAGASLAEFLLVAFFASGVTVLVYGQYLAGHVAKVVDRTAYFTAGPLRERQPFEDRYGPNHFSLFNEEWFIRDFFQDRRRGVFLDVGANHYRDSNNTFFLEKELDWSGIAVDALPDFAEGYRIHRPKTRFLALFASDVPGQSQRIFVPQQNNLLTSVSEEFTKKMGAPGAPREVPTTTLNVVLDQAGVTGLDFMSMDIELAEPQALAGFDIGRFRPELVCIEAHEEVRQQILDYFSTHHYVLVGKYLRVDTENLYFTPMRDAERK